MLTFVSDWEGDGGELPFQLGARVVEIETKKGDGSQQKFSTWIQGYIYAFWTKLHCSYPRACRF